jgi:hypothetical protein
VSAPPIWITKTFQQHFGLFSFQSRISVHLNMSERENGQFALIKQRVRSRISADVWKQIRTAYASGIGLREIARSMNIPEGTVLSHAKREGWARQIECSKALAKREDALLAVTPIEKRNERATGIEPAWPAWKAGTLPLSYARV